MSPIPLLVDAVALRPLRPNDARHVEPWLHDPETSKYMVMARTAPSAERWCRDLADAWPRASVRAIIYTPAPFQPSELVGVVGLYDIDWLARKAEFRIVMGAKRNLGIGTLATTLILRHGFQALNLHRIWLGTAEDNQGARQCFLKAGFTLEGRLKDDFWSAEGGYLDNVRYAILKSAWEKMNAQA